MANRRGSSPPKEAATSRTNWTSPGVLLTLLVLGTLAVHLIVALTTAYGLHRDEYLYLAMGQHLDWGFVEGPPGIALVAAGLQSTIGTSLVAVRLARISHDG